MPMDNLFNVDSFTLLVWFKILLAMMPYMTTHSVPSFDHDAICDNDGILGLDPNLLLACREKVVF